MCFRWFFIFLLPFNAWSWQVVQVKGHAHLERDSKPLLEKSEIPEGALIVTEAASKVLLKSGSQQVWIGPRTKFRIQPNAAGGSTLSLLYGKFRTKVSIEDAEKQRYEIPSAVAGVRGTEFFAQADETGEALCTIEGKVEVELKATGEKKELPVGKGLFIRTGSTPRVFSTSSFLVHRWVADTSLEESAVPASYGLLPDKHRIMALEEIDDVFWGGTAAYSMRGYESGLYQERHFHTMGYYSLSPFLQWGTEYHLFLKPQVLGTFMHMEMALDSYPAVLGHNYATTSMGEGYLAVDKEGWDLRVGLQEIEWNDGMLLSRLERDVEPVAHTGLRFQIDLPKDWGFEALVTGGEKNMRPLDGKTPVSLAGAQLRFPNEWGHFYFLQRDMGTWEAGAVYFKGHLVQDTGFFSRRKIHDWEYSLTIDRQWAHILRAHPSGREKITTAASIDGAMGMDRPFELPFKFTFRFLHTDPDFIPGFETYYNLGLSGVFVRSNIAQARAKFEHFRGEVSRVGLELISMAAVSDTGYKSWVQVSDNRVLGQELDLFYIWNPSTWEILVGVWNFFPGPAYTDQSVSHWGALANFRKSF